MFPLSITRPSRRFQARFSGNPREDQIAVDIEGADVTFPPFICRLPSSMVEQLTLNQLVWGSSPQGATNFPLFHSLYRQVRRGSMPA
jgi:hypothetical protein